ncbi:MAG: methyltransferase domain-containing protein [Spirochaetales bacterium]|nr:methyltransferase domain-containing protein [Spirochaetales bacterium]
MPISYEISGFNRRRKWKLFHKLFDPDKETTVLDVGFSEDEYTKTDNFIEKYFPFPENLTALGVDIPNAFKKRYPQVKAVHYDGTVFPFNDKAFEICWSNAVIEHVGGRKKQMLFLQEIHRVARQAFITTPNKYFPVETHTRIPFLHMLSKRIFDRYLRMIGKSWAAGDYMNLLSLKDFTSLLNDAGISNYRIYRNRLFGFTLDFVAVIFE